MPLLRFILLTGLIFILHENLLARSIPKDSAILCYRVICFSFSAPENAHSFKLEIASGIRQNTDSFARNIIQSQVSAKSKMVAEVPAFGRQYTWRILYEVNKEKKSSPLFHFSVTHRNFTDTSQFRLRILRAASKFKDCYVAVDAGGVIYDMTGNPVWSLPDTNMDGENVNDMKITTDGTVTFIGGRDAYEMSYDGTILWKAPNDGKVSGNARRGECYHHEFKKMANGHYMALGMQTLSCKTIPTASSVELQTTDAPIRPEGYKTGRFGTLVEYDKKGKVVWSWKTVDYLKKSDFGYFNPPDTIARFDPHDNSFFFDEKHKVIYLGYRNLNRVIKIQYPSGKILATYGQNFKNAAAGQGAGLFCNLHNVHTTKNGYLYFYNNNSCLLRDSLPTIEVLKEPSTSRDSFKTLWQYTCRPGDVSTRMFPSGGSVEELPDSSFFVNMGSEYSKLFIVSWNKSELWAGLPEKYNALDKKWSPIKEYRANLLTRKELENLVLHSQK